LSRSIILLGDKQYSNEATILSRAYIERLVNAAYLLVCDKQEYKNWYLYTYKQEYKILDNVTSKMGVTFGSKLINIDKIQLDKELEEAIKHYTSQKGRDITFWTSKSIDERIKIIHERSEIAYEILIATTHIFYSKASEALHGTLYGCAFHIGIFDPTMRNADDYQIKRYMDDEMAFMYYSLGTLLHTVFDLINEKIDIKDIISQMKNDLYRITKRFESFSSCGTGGSFRAVFEKNEGKS